jgi:hypothetical protein
MEPKYKALDGLFQSAPDLSTAILHTLAYADVFSYPLTVDEIHRYLTCRRSQYWEIEVAIDNIGAVRSSGEYYTLVGHENLAELRRLREANSRRLWPRALAWGKVISGLPFVRMLAVTGSLAMDNVDSSADIDYLVVTEVGRLWLCRALILLTARFALPFGVRLCPNYMISLSRLEFHERNLYNAHEIAQMVPLAGMAVYEELRAHNNWVEDFLPNAQGAPPKYALASRPGSVSAGLPGIEPFLRSYPFSALEHWEMMRKMKLLCREQGASPESEFSAHICKGHAHLHKMTTGRAFAQRLAKLEAELHR